MATKLDPVTEIPACAVIIRAIHERGATQAEALAELARRRLWLNEEQRAQAGLGRVDAPRQPSIRFRIGQRYRTRHRHPKTCTIVDIHRTYNDAGWLVRVEYVATHAAASGQLVTDYHVPDSTVAMGLLPDD